MFRRKTIVRCALNAHKAKEREMLYSVAFNKFNSILLMLIYALTICALHIAQLRRGAIL